MRLSEGNPLKICTNPHARDQELNRANLYENEMVQIYRDLNCSGESPSDFLAIRTRQRRAIFSAIKTAKSIPIAELLAIPESAVEIKGWQTGRFSRLGLVLSAPNRAIWCDCYLRFESRIANH